MQFKKKIIGTLLIGSGIITAPSVAFANDSSELEQLRALVQELDQKVRVLARQNELSAEEASAKQKAAPVVKASEKGFGLESADGKFKIQAGGLFQFDNRNYFDNNGAGTGTNDFAFRRVEPQLKGTLFGIYDFNILTEFAGFNGSGSAGILDAYVDARFNPAFKIRAGRFKAPASLERLQSGAALRFIERGYISDNLLPNRELGIQVHGDLFQGKFNYAAGIFNGQVDGQAAQGAVNNDTNNDKDFQGRVFFEPFKGSDSALAGLGFGISGTWGDVKGTATDSQLTSGYRTAGLNRFFSYSTGTYADGTRFRWSPQGYYFNGPFGLQAEYARVNQDVSKLNGTLRHAELDHDAWQVHATWVLTGEDNNFGTIKPKRPFDLDKGGLGAWEVGVRYQKLNVDSDTFTGNIFANPSTAAKEARGVALGLKWYLNDNVQFASSYEHTTFDGGAGTVANVRDRDDEDVLFARFQFSL